MELNSWDLWVSMPLSWIQRVDSTGCYESNLSTSVPKGVEIVNHGTGFAFVKPSGDFSIKQLTIGD